MNKKIIIIIFLIFYSFYISSSEAVIIVGGFFRTKYRMNKFANYLENQYGYKAFWINYMSRKGWNNSKENLENKIEKILIDDYDKVHIFCHIFGSKMMLDYFKDHKIENLESIIFDRGPIQEELGVAMRNISGEWFLKLAGGKNILEFTYKKGYKIPENLKDVNIGIIIETKAIYLCYYYKEEIIKGNPSFKITNITERYDDFFYIPLTHKEMYTKYDVFGSELNLFFKTGKFSKNQNREYRNYLEDF